MSASVSTTKQRIQRAIDFVEAHLYEDLALGVIAEQGGCSPWHFHRLFGAITGETPASYVWKRRLSEICRRLVETRQALVGSSRPRASRSSPSRPTVARRMSPPPTARSSGTRRAGAPMQNSPPETRLICYKFGATSP
jgi:AraC-like DNA-binding protein